MATHSVSLPPVITNSLIFVNDQSWQSNMSQADSDFEAGLT